MIKGYVIIRKNTIVLQGKEIFSGSNELNKFLVAAYENFRVNYPKFYKMDAISKAGFLAAELLLRECPSPYSGYEVGLVLSNSNSSIDTDMKYIESTTSMPSPALFVYTLPNIVVGEVCIRHKFKGENAFFVSEKFDASLVSGYVGILLETTSTKACIAGWIDVLGEHHDVFLYLKERNGSDAADSEAQQVEALYKSHLWNN